MLRARGTTVGVIVPAAGLRPDTLPADFFKTLRPADLAHCLLPSSITDAEGRMIRKPPRW